MSMTNMFNNSKLMDRFFRQVNGVMWDLMSGRVGIKTAEGIATVEGEGDDAQVTINMFDQFGLEVPAFAQNTPVDAIAVGDLIYGAKGPLGWVVEKTGKTFKLLKADGSRTSWTPPKVTSIGFDTGAMVLRSLANVLPSGTGGLSQMQNMLMPMLMMGGDVDLESIMPMMLFSQMNAPANPSGDPAAALLAQNQMAQMMQMMMMAQLMGGGKSGKSPFKNTNGGKSFFDN